MVPVVNEAAFAALDRTAEDGLDLARTCPGKADGSVTEQTAHAVSQLIQSADYLIDLHTGGRRYDILPFAGYALHPTEQVLATQRRMAEAFGLPVIWGTSPKMEGRTLSIARDANVPAIYAEWGGPAPCRPDAVAGYVQGCLNVMNELNMVEDAQRQNAGTDKLRIEDDREGSGHLQINNPSPIDGFFEPSVTLGQAVRAGETIGTVFSPTGEEQQPVLAQQSGVVLVLRAVPRVEQHEMLAVILETENAAI